MRRFVSVDGIKRCANCGFPFSGQLLCDRCIAANSSPKHLEPRNRAERLLREPIAARALHLIKPNQTIYIQSAQRAVDAVPTKTLRGKGSALCPICGCRIQPGKLLDHKSVMHGEKKYSDTAALPHKENLWVPIFAGGSPGLGKGKS
jgi:hypothetical protein